MAAESISREHCRGRPRGAFYGEILNFRGHFRWHLHVHSRVHFSSTSMREFLAQISFFVSSVLF